MNKYQKFSQKVLELQKEFGVSIDTIQTEIGTVELIVVDEESGGFQPLWNGVDSE
ncbi:hypothetical protein [Bacillus pumilus]|uniref:hypothetical protein n=1 Tax=Bacillus pumilus TaxID=1408 RepID=UPI0016535150|nr:hypothetical protein [Bacillus pumilus]